MKTLIAACLLSLSGFIAAQTPTTPETNPTTSSIAETTAPSQALTDAQIVTILQTANKAEIDAAKKAQKTAKQKDVIDFAKQMVTDHSKAEKDGKALMKKMKWKEQSSDIQGQLKTAAKDTEAKLKGKKGEDFGKTYIDEQVAAHQMVLNTIDQQLIPNAKNEDLKTMLGAVRSTVSGHLDHAKQIQGAVNAM